ncbi:TIGR02680 family protein [Pseudonocardia sp.]|uniref:TIGR02680 family protein n=1 Tax=Pseudonocardia sp. TaxID=60912 RepID=UPI0031FE31E9
MTDTSDPTQDMKVEQLGEAWLAAANGGGLPEPIRQRWQPLRVGIVDLWEYDKAEFWAADGRLVLRGGNGAGKTKVLELTTLMLLRGEIGASVLDPFGSQHRTMKFNLLPTGEADDPRPPADSGLGYAWVEFGRLDDTGRAHYFVCGMGMSARRGSGTAPVTPWHLVTSLRPGKDLTLRVGGRALDRKELSKVDGVSMPASAAAYRARIADELYGLTGDAYDNLTGLLKQLRRPKLGERLNPTNLAETLRDALPALAEHELTQLADGWDNLERLRTAVEQTEAAAAAVAVFLRSGWRPWARAVIRGAADTFTSATTKLEDTTRDKRAAEKVSEAARLRAEAAQAELGRKTTELKDGRVELRELLDRPAFKDAESAVTDVGRIQKEVEKARTAMGGSEKKVGQQAGRVAAAKKAWQDAETQRRQASAAVDDAAAYVGDVAGPAGLVDAVERHLVDRDHESLTAAQGLRAERFVRLAALHEIHRDRRSDAEKTAASVHTCDEAVTTATGAEQESRTEVDRRAGTLDTAVREWAALAVRHPVPESEINRWCELVPGLTVIDEENGTVDAGESVLAELRRHLAALRESTAGQESDLRLKRSPLARRREELNTELDAVTAAVDQPPPAPAAWSRRARPGLDAELGAPLWRLVDPRPGVEASELARIEAALAAAGLLDAWVSPDGQLADADGFWPADTMVEARSWGEPSLVDVLEPAWAGGVDTDLVARLLGGVGWHPHRPDPDAGTWIAADGSWRTAELTGRAEPAGPASYLGTAARAEARARRISAIELELSDLDDRIGALDRALDEVADDVAEANQLTESLPESSERNLATSVAQLAERARLVAVARRSLDDARRVHAGAQAAQDSAWAEFATYAGEHRFGLDDLPGQERAISDFATAVSELRSTAALLSARIEVVDGAAATVEQQEADLVSAQDEFSAAEQAVHEARIRLRLAEALLSADGRELLERRSALDLRIEQLSGEITGLQEALRGAEVDTAKADAVVESHETRRAEAERIRDAAGQRLWAVVDTHMLDPFEIDVPDRRNVTAARELAVEVRQRISSPPGDVDRQWRVCFTRLQELRQQLLPDRDVAVRDEDGGPVRVEVLADPAIGWESPHAAGTTLAERAQRQRDGYDAEQQEVLTRLLGSTFIEHLKDRLDYTDHTLTRINSQLVAHPTRRGHTIRVHWDATPTDPDAGMVVAALGRRGYDELSAENQTMVRNFLARRIEDARAGAGVEDGGDWKEHLTEALDYRKWLDISLQYRAGTGANWVPFDVARHSVKSGGEKVVLLAQPLFAAAVVAFEAADRHAPRWVWLDEAMTGVDTKVKSSFMGLTVQLDLDIMLTAHDEWCTYPTVPAVAVHDLARHSHLPGVDVVPYLWCGGDLTSVDTTGLGRPDEVNTPPPADDDPHQFGFDLA